MFSDIQLQHISLPGHAVSVDQTKWVFDILQRFTQQKGFDYLKDD